MSQTSKRNSNSGNEEFKYNDKYIKWILFKIQSIKKSCKDKEFSKDDFLEIYFHLIRLINTWENKKLSYNVKKELLKIKKCCDEDCNCSYRSERFLKIYDDLLLIIDKNISKFNLDIEIKENSEDKLTLEKRSPIEEKNKVEEIKKVEEVKEELIKEEIPKKQKVIDESKYENKVYENSSYVLELDYDKTMKVETDYLKDFSTINDKKHSSSFNYIYEDYDEIEEEDDYDLMNVFAYIYNLGKQSIKPGESASFDQKPIINSIPDTVSFIEPSSIVLNESGVYDLLYFAQTEEKNINLALYINDNEIEGTCANSTSYSNTICSQGLLIVPDEKTPVTITLRNTDAESNAVFNESIQLGQVNLSILIRKIS